MDRRMMRYPRTPHLPWSDGPARDDDVLTDTSHFNGQEVVVTKKYDGENTSIYPDGYTHARSLDGKFHPSQAWIKAFAAQVAWQLPEHTRLIGENLYAKHSIGYDNLPSFFLLFAVIGPEQDWPQIKNDGTITSIPGPDIFWGWDDTEVMASFLGIHMVDVLYRGPWNEKLIRDLKDTLDLTKDEGYVVRVTNCFYPTSFKKSIAKYVRPHHVQTEKHWSQTWEPNKMNPQP